MNAVTDVSEIGNARLERDTTKSPIAEVALKQLAYESLDELILLGRLQRPGSVAGALGSFRHFMRVLPRDAYSVDLLTYQELPPTIFEAVRRFTSRHEIDCFPGEPYAVRKPIPVSLNYGPSSVLASFDEANIAMSGDTPAEAMANLAADILDTFDAYDSERGRLGPGPQQQLCVLDSYISKR
ncbi:MAG TPA: hypothetical protein VEB21_12865 [Terriglobales bacterium]|nr:hypothetical protein [Terriglobales bacterium]